MGSSQLVKLSTPVIVFCLAFTLTLMGLLVS